jgi:hypothetical protein
MRRLLLPLAFAALVGGAAPVAAQSLPADPCATDRLACQELLREVMVSRLQMFPNGLSGEIVTYPVTVGGPDLPWIECLVPTPRGYALTLCLPAEAISGSILAPKAIAGSGIAQPPLELAPRPERVPEPEEPIIDPHREAMNDHHARHNNSNVALLLGLLVAIGAFVAGRLSAPFGISRRGK